MSDNSQAIKVTITAQMIEAIMREWEHQHPGRDAAEMSPDEFADRLMKATMDTAVSVDRPSLPAEKPNV